jgi:hypothetical protein
MFTAAMQLCKIGSSHFFKLLALCRVVPQEACSIDEGLPNSPNKGVRSYACPVVLSFWLPLVIAAVLKHERHRESCETPRRSTFLLCASFCFIALATAVKKQQNSCSKEKPSFSRLERPRLTPKFVHTGLVCFSRNEVSRASCNMVC